MKKICLIWGFLFFLVVGGCDLIAQFAGFENYFTADAQESETVAVLNITLQGEYAKKNIKSSEADFITRTVRNYASNTLRNFPYLIMDANNMESVLKKYNKTLECVDDTACAVDIGQYLEAVYIITGNIQKFGSNYFLVINMYDTGNMQNISNMRIKVKIDKSWQDKIGENLEKQAPQFFDILIKKTGSSKSRNSSSTNMEMFKDSSNTSGTSMLSVTTKPEKGVKLTVTNPKQESFVVNPPYKNPDAMSGVWKIKAESSGFAPSEIQLVLIPDDAKKVAINLKKYASLSAIGRPRGAKVKINGPNNLEIFQRLPFSQKDLAPGNYKIEVMQDGYSKFSKSFELAPGTGESLNISLEKGFDYEEMVFVPAGKFLMGCNTDIDKKCLSNEKPIQKVYLDSFFIDKYETTVEQYSKCVKAKYCSTFDVDKTYKLDLKPDGGFGKETCNWGVKGYEKHPMNCVNWRQASLYCTWKGKRLPTEAEWEKAARGSDGRMYPWGNLDVLKMYQRGRKAANVSDMKAHETYSHWLYVIGYNDGFVKTAPIGTYIDGVSPYGVHDMLGNVFEWTSSWYDEKYFSKMPLKNPQGLSSGKYKVSKGGSWGSKPSLNTTSYRLWNEPEYRNHGLGFRCAKSE